MTIDEKVKRFGKVKVLDSLGHYKLSKRLDAALRLKEKAKNGNDFANIGNVLNECGELEILAIETLYKYK